MTALWTSDEAATATDGTLQGPSWSASGVSIDTRTLKRNDLFVALKDVRDGHDFVANALEKGAAAALVTHVPKGVDENAPLILVDDVLAALEKLGVAARARTRARVIAITGSAGKTSTKDMLRSVLEKQGRTHAAEASYNNHWGVPLTLARMPESTEFAVIEIGMNHPGEIAPLAKLTRPHIAIVTTVAAAHLEAFPDVDAIAHEKAALFQGLEPEGTALFNADVETAPILNAEAKVFAGRRIGFGEREDASLRVESITLRPDSSIVEGRFDGASFLLKVGAPGRHFAMNALAVFGAAKLAGADRDTAAMDIGAWQAPKGRGQRETLSLDAVEDKTFELIDDAFNANPASMAAAFDVLAVIQPETSRGRRIAILGDMLELGERETELHAALADHTAMSEIDRVDCVGPRMRALYEALPEDRKGTWVETADELAAEAHRLAAAGDVILVKGSKGSQVSRVVDALKALDKVRGPGQERGTD